MIAFDVTGTQTSNSEKKKLIEEKLAHKHITPLTLDGSMWFGEKVHSAAAVFGVGCIYSYSLTITEFNHGMSVYKPLQLTRDYRYLKEQKMKDARQREIEKERERAEKQDFLEGELIPYAQWAMKQATTIQAPEPTWK